MSYEEMQKSIADHDRQIASVVSLLATLAERITGLVNLAEIQNARLTRLEDGL